MNSVNEEQNIGTTVEDRETDWRVLRALDAEIAERVMGWTRHPKQTHRTDNRTIGGVLYCPPGFPEISRGGFNCVPRYSGDIKAATEVEDRIVALNLEDEYGDALVASMSGALKQKFDMGRGAFYGYEVFEIAHAAPEQRCRAALKAIECLSGSDNGTDGQAS